MCLLPLQYLDKNCNVCTGVHKFAKKFTLEACGKSPTTIFVGSVPSKGLRDSTT